MRVMARRLPIMNQRYRPAWVWNSQVGTAYHRYWRLIDEQLLILIGASALPQRL
jgi:hypothetical protein